MAYSKRRYAIRDLQAADVLVEGSLSAAKFEEVSGRSRYDVMQFFDSWNRAKAAAGLQTEPPKNGMSNNRKRRRIQMIKEFLPCYRCGEHYPAPVMEFHHREADNKEFHIRRGDQRRWEDIERELTKCDLLCANCHRIVEHVES